MNIKWILQNDGKYLPLWPYYDGLKKYKRFTLKQVLKYEETKKISLGVSKIVNIR